MNKKNKVKKIVKEHYDEVAKKQASCCSCGCGGDDIAQEIGYGEDELAEVGEANLNLGCGNPVSVANINQGETVLDLGSGPGFDCFLAAKKVGKEGRVVGVDISESMIDLANKNKQKYGFENVEFKLGEIEDLPVESESVDVVISNCVVNLSPEKSKVFREVRRVLKPGGRLYLSDIVLLKELTDEQREDEELLAGCVAGALLIDDYLEKIKQAGFRVKILAEDKEISKRQYQGIDLESIKIEAIKK